MTKNTNWNKLKNTIETIQQDKGYHCLVIMEVLLCIILTITNRQRVLLNKCFNKNIILKFIITTWIIIIMHIIKQIVT